MASSMAACVFGGVRLISSASIMFANTGPGRNLYSRPPVSRSSWMTSVPVMSLGIKSGVNWMRLNDRCSASASELTMSVFARPGTPSSSACPRLKTLLVSSLAEALHLSFKRIQFTPDLMPSDVTGTDVIQENLQTRRREYKFLPGPLFANMILADEINRTPPKTQAAMLEAMQERQVTPAATMHMLPAPFFVLATQNPLEQEGTYPLPEAQLDRFLLYINVDYPSGAEEWEIARRVTTGKLGDIDPVLTADESSTSKARHARPRQRPGARLRLGPGPRLAARTRPRPRTSSTLGELGRRPPRRADAGLLRQGPGRAVRPVSRHDRRRAGRREAGPAASHRRQLRRPGRRKQRRTHRHAAGSGAGRQEVRKPAA